MAHEKSPPRKKTGLNVAAVMKRVRAYAEEAGVRPEVIARRATGNAHMFPRMERRLQTLLNDAGRLDKYMNENPLVTTGCDECHDNRHSEGVDDDQAASP